MVSVIHIGKNLSCSVLNQDDRSRPGHDDDSIGRRVQGVSVKEGKTVRIHAIQTGTVMVKERQRRGKGRGKRRLLNTMLDRNWTQPLPINVWVIEHPEGVIVVDTGETARTSDPGYFTWWHPYFKFGVKEFVEPEEEIGPQLRALGIPPKSVRWVIMTHLHTDHAGGLHHFPESEIIVSRREYELASGIMGQVRGYLPQRWPKWFAPRLIDFEPEPLGPFPTSLALTEAGDVTLVPTPGHSGGHLSVIVQDQGTSLFFAGDTSYTEQLMLDRQIDGVAPDEMAARKSLDRIQRYFQLTPTVYLPSHDPRSADRLAKHQLVTSGETRESLVTS
jgi:glyoxylase-like metal-dependent hydrolase (beta-lactamase superfamily II)